MMYDLSKKMQKFYDDKVVLSNKEQNSLRQKKNINIKRLREGLKEYNEENDTNYKIAETRVQGSMAMHTVVQNDNKDYDIDVAIIFDKCNLGDDIGPLVAKRIVQKALAKKCKMLNTEPEVLTNCVRVTYADGYHIDFAVYRRFKEDEDSKYSYEHAGSEWSPRDPAAINEWFLDEVNNKGKELIKIVRLSKMFCKSRDFWINMPGGLLQTVLCAEKMETSYDRLDEMFYYTMVQIRDRLKDNMDVYNPTDQSLSLITTEKHKKKMNNWYTRLDKKVKELEILFDDNCKEEDAIEAWYRFFNHEFWNEKSLSYEYFETNKSYYEYNDTEEFIGDVVDICEQYSAKIICKVSGNGFIKQPIEKFFKKFPVFKNALPHGFSVDFEVIDTDVPYPYKVWWKVRNIGVEAEKRNMIRGQIEKTYYTRKHETADFYGPHYVECYIIKDDRCVAIEHIDVPIGKE